MNKQLQNKIKAYGVLAAAATFASSQADAQLVVRSVNHTNSGSGDYELDIDNDGVVDFTITATTFSYPSYYGLQGAYVSMNGAYNSYASASSFNSNSWTWYNNVMDAGKIEKGVNIGWDASFSYGQLLNGFFTYSAYPGYGGSFGNIAGENQSYVGVQFVKMDANGLKNLHYGWVKFENIGADGMAYTITEVAYETQPQVAVYTDKDYGKDFFISHAELAGSFSNLTQRAYITPVSEHKYFGDVDYYHVKFVKSSDVADYVNYPDQIWSGRDYYVNENGSSADKVVNNGNPVQDVNFNNIERGESYVVFTVAFNNDDEPVRLTSYTTVMSEILSTEELNASMLDIYAADKTVNINAGNEHINSTVRIFDVTGKEVYTGTVDSNKKSITLNDAAGIYIVNVEGKAGKTSHKVILK